MNYDMLRAASKRFSAVSVPSSIPSCQSIARVSESSHGASAAIRVTYNMVHQLTCIDEPRTSQTEMRSEESKSQTETEIVDRSPQLMILYDSGDIDCALHFLLQSLHEPFAPNVVATILVQESIYARFEERVRNHLHVLREEVFNNPKYIMSLEKIDELELNTIAITDEELAPPFATPILLCKGRHDVLGPWPTGVITMHTFQSTGQASKLCGNDSLGYAAVSIWNETLVGAYNLAVLIDSPIFFLNCCNVQLAPIMSAFEKGKTMVLVEKNFHYETLQIHGKARIIVFPMGTFFAHKKDVDAKVERPIDYLNDV